MYQDESLLCVHSAWLSAERNIIDITTYCWNGIIIAIAGRCMLKESCFVEVVYKI